MIKKNSPKFVVAPIRIAGHNDFKHDMAGVKMEKSFINHTLKNIVVVDRIGFQNVIEPAVKSSMQRFIIRTTYRFTKGYERARARKYFRELEINEGQYPQLALLRDAFLEKDHDDHEKDSKSTAVPGVRTSADIIIIIDSYYTEEEIFEGDIYCTDHDLIISMSDPEKIKIEHPFNTVVTVEEKYRDMLKGHLGIGVNIEIIDNDNSIGDRFISIAGNVMRIKPARDSNRENGIYYTLTQQGTTESSTETTRFDFGEKEKTIGLWPTKEEALAAGDVKTLMSKEVAQINHETIIQKGELDLASKEAEKEAIERDARKKAMDEFYEARSYERKDTYEMIKVVGGIAAGLIGLWALLMKGK